ncbi:hypothetical protein, partial [Marinobacter xestospongiae]
RKTLKYCPGLVDHYKQHASWLPIAFSWEQVSVPAIEHFYFLRSPYPRALDTVLPFAEASGLEIEVLPCLAEGQPVTGNAP